MIKIEIPILPAPKANNARFSKGRFYYNPKTQQNIDDLIVYLYQEKMRLQISTIKGFIKCIFIFHTRNKRQFFTDTDNRIKTLQDTMIKAGIIADDKMIVETQIKKFLDGQEKTVIEIFEVDPGEYIAPGMKKYFKGVL